MLEIEKVELDELYARADVITFHVPFTRKGNWPTFHLGDREFLERLKPGTMLAVRTGYTSSDLGVMPNDFDQDGDGDIGLFVRRETGSNVGAREAGEWFLDVNTDLSETGTITAEFEPPLTGLPGLPFVNQDIFFNFNEFR